MKAVNLNIQKTALYAAFSELEATEKKGLPTKAAMDALEEEIFKISTAHSLFVFTIRNLHVKAKKIGLKPDTRPVFKEQFEAISSIVKHLETLNNYYYADETANKTAVDKED